MKTLLCGLAMSLGISAGAVSAEQTLTVDGTDYPLSTLMANCQNITDAPAVQIACFNNLTRLIAEQSGQEQRAAVPISKALDSLRALAQYQDDETGLTIAGSDCTINIVYFNNYFHISRRNISTIDLFSAQFDASKLQYDQIVRDQGGQAPLSKGAMDAGATALMHGGLALESGQHNFSPRSPGTTLGAYASEVVGELPGKEEQTVEFVLVHPKRAQASAEIWSAFEAFVTACHT
jgi:hypothetical protein